MAVRKQGRPPFKATPALARRVEELKACGMTDDQIAKALGCSDVTLRKHFAENLDNGAQRKRAEAVGLLWKSARSGNVAAQKKLEEMTGRAVAEESFKGDVAADEKRSPVKPARVGKKEQAAEEARAAGLGTDWGDDLHLVGRPN